MSCQIFIINYKIRRYCLQLNMNMFLVHAVIVHIIKCYVYRKTHLMVIETLLIQECDTNGKMGNIQ